VIAAEQEEDLRLEGVARPVGVEVAEEGIFLEDFEHQLGLELRLQQPGEGCLADPDDALDCKKHRRSPCDFPAGQRGRWCLNLKYTIDWMAGSAAARQN